VAVNGVCLTCKTVDKDTFSSDILRETLERTNLGKLTEGARVNLETSLTPSSPIGGHLVYGHVDAVIKVLLHKRRNGSKESELWCELPPEFSTCVFPGASVALNGVSLTVREVLKDRFSVSLVSYTLENTNLSELRKGDLLNVEFDLVIKSVYHTVSNLFRKKSLTNEGIGKLGYE